MEAVVTGQVLVILWFISVHEFTFNKNKHTVHEA